MSGDGLLQKRAWLCGASRQGCVGALKAAEGCVEGWCVGVLKVTGCVVLKAGVLGC